jgi:HAD superfamily hydrolase (TIGR01509 family)
VTLKHMIFDCDGVLVDSEPLSMRADVMLLAQHGITISEAEAHNRFVGTTFQAMLDMMTQQFGTVFPPELQAVKNTMVEALYRSELKIVPGVVSVLDTLKARGISASIGSNSPKKRVELAIELVGIADRFDRIVSYEDVTNGKPAPDIFLRAAELAGAAIDECIVVEDSITGVTAAVAAGIRTFGFTGTHGHPEQHAKDLKRVGADVVIAHMSELIPHLQSLSVS